jgi:hypothetical protein
MVYVDLIATLLFFGIGNVVAYVANNTFGITQIPPAVISVIVQSVLVLLVTLLAGPIPYASEFIIAEIIVVVINQVLVYLTGTSI